MLEKENQNYRYPSTEFLREIQKQTNQALWDWPCS